MTKRIVLGGTLLIVAIVASSIAGGAGVLMTAAAVPSAGAFGTIGLLALLVVAFVIGWPAFGWLDRRRPRRDAVFACIIAVAWWGISAMTVLRAFPIRTNGAPPERVRRSIGAERIILIGRSFGAALAAHYMAVHADHVARAILVSPGVLWEGAFPEDSTGDPWTRLDAAQRARHEELLSDPRLLAQAVLMEVNPNAAHDFVSDAEADARFREILLNGKDATSCPGGAPVPVRDNPPGFYSNQLTDSDSKKLPDPRPRLRKVQVPVFILRGECDYLKSTVADDYQRTFLHSTLVHIPGAGHGIPHDQPETYVGLLQSFLRDRPPER